MQLLKKHLSLLTSTPHKNNSIDFNAKGWRSVNLRLFKELDDSKTKEKVDELLSQYRRLLRIAGTKYEPSVTTTFKLEPTSITNQEHNSQLDHMILQEEAFNTLVDIWKAYNSLDPEQRHLIYDKYLAKHKLVDYNIYPKYNWSQTTFYRELKKCLVMFAEAYRGGELLIFKNGRNVVES